MALSGEAHVVILGVEESDGTAGADGKKRGHHGGLGRLRFFSAEASPHALADRHDLVEPDAEHFGDHRLHFARMLGRGMDGDCLPFAGDGDADLRFQVEMVLPADFENAFNAMIRLGESPGQIAAMNPAFVA